MEERVKSGRTICEAGRARAGSRHEGDGIEGSVGAKKERVEGY